MEEITKDPRYQICIYLANLSKSRKMKYGSFLEKQGEILGVGWNRRPRQPEDFGENKLRGFRGPHAEMAAYNQAAHLGSEVEGSNLYVAGVFAENIPGHPETRGHLAIYQEPHYTCGLCPTKFIENDIQIGRVFVPLPDEWHGFTLEEAIESRNSLGVLEGPLSTNEMRAVKCRSETLFADVGISEEKVLKKIGKMI